MENDKEQFAAHYITAKSDFDQVIEIKSRKKLALNQKSPYLIAIQNGKEVK